MEIRPFKAYRYALDQLASLDQVISPPYDKITPEHRQRLIARDPHNYVQLILGPTYPPPEAWYGEAAGLFAQWRREGILKQDHQSAYYVLRQKFTNPWTKRKHIRQGFLGVLRLPPGGQGILPHERTFDAPKADRLKFMQAIAGNLESIFVLYSDPKAELQTALGDGAQLLASATDEYGTEIELLAQTHPEAGMQVARVLGDQQICIADGHHRFETACNFRELRRSRQPNAGPEAPFEFMLMYFCAFEDEGLCVLPTHRVIRGVGADRLAGFQDRMRDFFQLEECASLATAVDRLVADSGPPMLFAWAAPGGKTYLCRLTAQAKAESLLGANLPEPVRRLDVALLHGVVIEHLLGINRESDAPNMVSFAHNTQSAQQALDEGAEAVFLLRPTPPAQVRTVAGAGARMPQKSTDFFPKIQSGLVAFLHID